MGYQATIEKMKLMKLKGMVRAFSSVIETEIGSNFSPDELIAYLVDSEWDERYNRKLTYLLRVAKFRYKVSFADIDFTKNRNLNKDTILRLSDCQWIKKGKGVIVTGATGVGKSFLVSALGNQACINGYKTMYFNCMKIFSKLKIAKADGTYMREMEKIRRQDLLILDDFGLEPLDASGRLIFLEILEDRYKVKSTVITSQLPMVKWHDIINEPTIADAICDRIFNHSHIIELKGESMRKREKNN